MFYIANNGFISYIANINDLESELEDLNPLRINLDNPNIFYKIYN